MFFKWKATRHFACRRLPQFFLLLIQLEEEMDDDLIFFQMEDDLNNLAEDYLTFVLLLIPLEEENLILFSNGR